MNEPQPATIGDVHREKPDVSHSVFAVPRGHGSALAREKSRFSIDSDTDVVDLDGLERQTAGLQIPEDLLFRQHGAVRPHEHVVVRIECRQRVVVMSR
jgi:hypothetical protein